MIMLVHSPLQVNCWKQWSSSDSQWHYFFNATNAPTGGAVDPTKVTTGLDSYQRVDFSTAGVITATDATATVDDINDATFEVGGKNSCLYLLIQILNI